VTGTDTGVGKTVVCAALMHRCRPREPEASRPELPPYGDPSVPASIRYWKPIQTGIEQDDDTASVRQLGSCAPDQLLDEGVRLPRPVSPHLAARSIGRSIGLAPLLDLAAAQPSGDRWVVEGAGGVLVPLNDAERMIDLMAALGLPALVVSRSTLGTINHTLLTLEALRARRLRVAGVVMVGPPDRDNRAAIESYGETVVIGELPPVAPLTPEALRHWATTRFDPDGRLAEYFR
jgi:dethiobiotin synthase